MHQAYSRRLSLTTVLDILIKTKQGVPHVGPGQGTAPFSTGQVVKRSLISDAPSCSGYYGNVLR